MTREEAIIQLKGLKEHCSEMSTQGEIWVDDVNALDMAIKSLEQEPCDCISRKALLEEVENGIKAGNCEEGYEEYQHITNMDDIIECIEYADSVQPKAEQKTPQVARWIPVSKELPERDVNVLAYCKNNSFEYQKVMWIDDYTGRWYGYLSHFDKVLAWMPLPEPYKESEG